MLAVGTVTCSVAVALATGDGWAAASPALKASRNCRKAIAIGLRQGSSTTALGVIGSVPQGSRQGEVPGRLQRHHASRREGAKVAGAETKARAAIDKKCLAGEAVLRQLRPEQSSRRLPSIRRDDDRDDQYLRARCAADRRRQGQGQVSRRDREGGNLRHRRDPEGRHQMSERRGQAGGHVRGARVRRDRRQVGSERRGGDHQGVRRQADQPARTSAAASRFRVRHPGGDRECPGVGGGDLRQVPTPTPTPTSTQTPKFTATPRDIDTETHVNQATR